MAFSNYPWGSVPTIHLSYHQGEHYNSVRLLDDPCTGVPLPIGHELTLKEELAAKPKAEAVEETKQESTVCTDSDNLPTVRLTLS